MTSLRGRAALWATLLGSAAATACGVDDRLLSPCGTGGSAAVGGKSGGSGGSTSTVDGSTEDAGAGGTAPRPDGSSDGGSSPVEDSGVCTDCPPNVVVNADFDVDVNGWVAEPKSIIEWDEEDAQGSDSSGSIQVHNNHVEDIVNNTAVGARQCGAASPGAVYEISAKVLIRLTEGSGNGHVSVGFFAGKNCEPPQLTQGGFTTTSSFRVGAWENERGETVAPVNAQSIAVRLVAEKPLRQETLAVVFDEVRVVKKD